MRTPQAIHFCSSDIQQSCSPDWLSLSLGTMQESILSSILHQAINLVSARWTDFGHTDFKRTRSSCFASPSTFLIVSRTCRNYADSVVGTRRDLLPVTARKKVSTTDNVGNTVNGMVRVQGLSHSSGYNKCNRLNIVSQPEVND
jgi:hypothetical protein